VRDVHGDEAIPSGAGTELDRALISERAYAAIRTIAA